MKKLGISKNDLIQLKKSTKDGPIHWFHKITEKKIFTNDINGKLDRRKKKLYEKYQDEIEEIKTKINKSLKKKKEKKNKSTKSKVIVKDTDDELKDLEKELECKK